jgi:hypothetical protein
VWLNRASLLGCLLIISCASLIFDYLKTRSVHEKMHIAMVNRKNPILELIVFVTAFIFCVVFDALNI